jgi:hypothetical protein
VGSVLRVEARREEEPEPRCEGCGHPEHSGLCRELEMPGSPGDVDECGCLAPAPEEPPLTPEEEERLAAKYAAAQAEHEEAGACTCSSRTLNDLGEVVHADDCPIAPGQEPWPCGDCGAQVAAEEQFCPHCSEEEEEAGNIGFCPCGNYVAPHPFPGCSESAPAAPPQPERRLPLAIAYSIQGHLYEIALPGDATIRAVDGALIITHSLGPVAGIVQARPMEGEQSA